MTLDKKLTFGMLGLLSALLLGAALPEREGPAFDAGTTWRIGKNAVTVIPARSNVHAWCVIADSRNTDIVNVRLGTTAATTITNGGIALSANASICDPVGGGTVYSQTVTAAAQTTAGTLSTFSPGPVVYTFEY